MFALKGIYENGTITFNRHFYTVKPVNVIVTFIDEDLDLNTNNIDETKKNAEHLLEQKSKYADFPIEWGNGEQQDINDFVNIWEDKNISLGEIRNKAWKRDL